MSFLFTAFLDPTFIRDEVKLDRAVILRSFSDGSLVRIYFGAWIYACPCLLYVYVVLY
jgi:hypothetical protein